MRAAPLGADNRPMLTTDSPSKSVRVLTLDRPDALNAMTVVVPGEA